MEIKTLENPINEKEEKKNESFVLHQTSEDIISEYDGTSQKNISIEDTEKDINKNKEMIDHPNNSLADKISE